MIHLLGEIMTEDGLGVSLPKHISMCRLYNANIEGIIPVYPFPLILCA